MSRGCGDSLSSLLLASAWIQDTWPCVRGPSSISLNESIFTVGVEVSGAVLKVVPTKGTSGEQHRYKVSWLRGPTFSVSLSVMVGQLLKL